MGVRAEGDQECCRRNPVNAVVHVDCIYTYILIQVGKTEKRGTFEFPRKKKIMASGERPRLQISTNRQFDRLDCLSFYYFFAFLRSSFFFLNSRLQIEAGKLEPTSYCFSHCRPPHHLASFDLDSIGIQQYLLSFFLGEKRLVEVL